MRVFDTFVRRIRSRLADALVLELILCISLTCITVKTQQKIFLKVSKFSYLFYTKVSV